MDKIIVYSKCNGRLFVREESDNVKLNMKNLRNKRVKP